jgi:hypothetical protein
MKSRRVLGEKSGYWNIKGLGHCVMFFCTNFLEVMGLG